MKKYQIATSFFQLVLCLMLLMPPPFFLPFFDKRKNFTVKLLLPGKKGPTLNRFYSIRTEFAPTEAKFFS